MSNSDATKSARGERRANDHTWQSVDLVPLFRKALYRLSSESPLRRREHPVIGLRVLPNGPHYLFGDFGKQFLRLGRSPECDIRIDARYVSGDHCLIYRDRRTGAVFVHDVSRNGTRINGLRTKAAELREGHLLTVGTTHMVAFTLRSYTDRPAIVASTLREFVRKAMQIYTHERAAAYGIGVARSTLRGWLKKWKLK